MKNNQKGFVSLVIVGALVIIIGMSAYFAWHNKSSESIVNQVEENTTSKDDTSNWKTYINTKYGFWIKYPSNYKLVEEELVEGESQINMDSETCTPVFDSFGGPWPKDCLDYQLLIQKNKISIEGPSSDVVKTQTQAAGYSAEKIEDTSTGMFDGANQILVQFQKDDNWYISFMTYHSENKIAAETLLNQILSTFKFTE
jgi:hypothetical protein